ncbi:MAG: imidazole glycerol phosphate synthase subunit HisH [Lachnospiraceae bacterium]|nr:imidazole glycerol phosphate synthase subunit HisH [Lachnospiraceae bacterium]
MTAIIDYGVGNLFSLRGAFAALGLEARVTGDRQVLRDADRIVLPGVGAFADAAARLSAAGLDDVLCTEVQKGKPLLGICLGMQLLFEKSFEYGEHPGLSLLSGTVVPLEGRIPNGLKIPHMGWNRLEICRESPLFSGIRNGDHVYFVHSYHACGCQDSLLATAEYGVPVTAAVGLGNVFGCQFHPEKSGAAGLAILKAFTETEGLA